MDVVRCLLLVVWLVVVLVGRLVVGCCLLLSCSACVLFCCSLFVDESSLRLLFVIERLMFDGCCLLFVGGRLHPCCYWLLHVLFRCSLFVDGCWFLEACW